MSEHASLSEAFRSTAGVLGGIAAAFSAVAINEGYVLATQAYDQAQLHIRAKLARKGH